MELQYMSKLAHMDRFIGHERLIYLGVSSLINHTFKQPITIQLQHQKGGQFAAKNTGQFVAKKGGQFTAKKGGHFARNFQRYHLEIRCELIL
jgi:hypothetical protein